MPVRGYDIFDTDPDVIEGMACKVCGTLCNVERNLTGPTGGRSQWRALATGMIALPAEQRQNLA